ncbi:Mnd1 family protein [Necator americanus]|uniref:Meiotic nuclear division protein 1 homolog n=1 Tax=Necator americanus TaxID=51031 RepID=W2TIR7_NECAM|nr:Mnd1 family protein [Necator americanus]ETN81056.1 Mnd1 family protein [Necator americanus]
MAARKKGLSLEEKRAKMLELFYESQDIFQMKELEKIAPKKKGVISQSVKEVTQSLLDDGLIECEKIGPFVCYWAFPSKAMQTDSKRRSELLALYSNLEAQEKDLSKGLDKYAQCSHEVIAQRKVRAERNREEINRWTGNVPSLCACAPSLSGLCARRSRPFEELERRIKRKSTFSFLDNILSIKKWCKSEFGMEENVLDQQFEIPADLDYI